MAFVCRSLATGLAAGLIWQSAQRRVTPYVVEVDRLGGVQAVGTAVRPYKPADAEIAYHIAPFGRDDRALSIDPIVVRKHWLSATYYSTDRGRQILNEFYSRIDPST